MSETRQNHFVAKLVNLQQDGSGAISAPSNWMSPPLLEVTTELDDIVSGLPAAMLRHGGTNQVGRWHFFIGSPGNGKSAAVGNLCRQLLSAGCRIVTEDRHVDIRQLRPGQIPYRLEVCEEGNRYASAWLAQDASVVKHPFSRHADPARELLQLLADAWHKGVSLVLCTNRGVVEKAFRQAHLDQSMNMTPWFRAMKTAVEAMPGDVEFSYDPDSRRKPFERFRLTYAQLDDRSLLIGTHTFRSLVEKATAQTNWEICDDCVSAPYCPFHLNRAWLVDETGLMNTLTLLARAELMDGQIIVLREALALISLLLAGCPRDYSESPCDWVHGRLADGDIFGLACRRVHMVFFSSYAPYGLESTILATRQRECLKGLLRADTGESQEALRALKCALERQPKLSSDVGLSRLLGPAGVFQRLDPFKELLPASFYDTWDGTTGVVANHGSPLVSPLEKRCCELWADLESLIEGIAEDSVERFRWLWRWASSHTVRLGALLEDQHAFVDELRLLMNLLEFKTRPLSTEDYRRLDQLEQHLKKVLGSATREGIRVSEFATIAGPWPEQHLEPHFDLHSDVQSLGLPVTFGAANDAPSGSMGTRGSVSAPTFVWLARRLHWHLSDRTFPEELLEGVVSSQARAAARSKYAYQPEGVVVHVQAPDGRTVMLKRRYGDALIDGI